MKFFIICPGKIATGGVELCHQLCYNINQFTDATAKVCYIKLGEDKDGEDLTDGFVWNVEPMDAYADYHVTRVNSLSEMDQIGNIVIIPEGVPDTARRFSKACLALWWMSVDNMPYKDCLDLMGDLDRKYTFFLVQSYYALDFVKNHFPDKPALWLSDYINDLHGQFLFPAEYRRNIAVFNPKKGFDKLEPLIRKADWLIWVPLQGMTFEKMILIMQSAKIYVDFGHHPGKDRIPREAAANGLCVITNKEGSAAFQGDVPIPERYKFADPASSIDEIDALLHDICDNFAGHQENFADYRTWIKGEKAKFTEDIIKLVDLSKTLKYVEPK